MSRTVFAFACAALAVAAAHGDGTTANWLPTAGGTYSLVAPENWDTGVPPTNDVDTANFAPGSITGEQSITLPGISGFSTWHLGVVQGASNQTIKLPARHTNGTTTRYLYLADPSEFRGTWAPQDSHSRIHITPTNDVVPSLANLNTSLSPYLYVHGGTGVVENVTGGGTLLKVSAGTLRIKGTDPSTGARTRLQLGDYDSSVILENGDSSRMVAMTPPVTDGIYVRFDASCTNSFTIEEENGTKYISAWRDADGRSVTATPYVGTTSSDGAERNQRPWLSKFAVEVGMARVPIVDFGAKLGSSQALIEELGPPASMTFTPGGIREIFLVWQDVTGASEVFVLGETNDYHLHRGSAGSLLNGTFYNEYHSGDETYVDGVRRSWTFGSYDFTKLTVASMNLSIAVPINTLAQDRRIRFGGCRIAEAILYSRELTSAERLSVHKYLQSKWMYYGPHNLREIRVTARDQPVGVEDGHTVNAGILNIPSNVTFLKKGGGTLNFDALVVDGLSMNVEGGSVGFKRLIDDVDDNAPADGATLWLDATVDASFVRTNLEDRVAGRDYIDRWNDRRPSQTAIYAYPLTTAVDTNRPFVVTGVANGNAVVDFGTGYIQGSHSWAGYYDHDGSDAARFGLSKQVMTYEGFIVLRMKNPNSYYRYFTSDADAASGKATYACPPIFGSTAQDFTRWGDGSNHLLAGFASQYALAAYWTVDCRSICPNLEACDLGVDDFHVIAFSSEETVKVDRVADDRNITMAGVEIGEMILYTHKLTERERRTTEAYLMKKWLGSATPATRPSISLGNVTFAEGSTATIASDRPVTVESLSMPTNAVIGQEGPGSLTVSDTAPVGRGYSADGGVLNVTIDPLGDALYHFDATRSDTLVVDSVTDNGDGTSTTNIAQWLDVRKNGMAAHAVVGRMVCSVVSKANAPPTLQTVETRDGKMMPVMDFGPPGGVAASAGMEILKNGAGLGNAFVRELHVVYSDAHGGYGSRFIFADHSYYPFHRGDSNGQMFCAYGQEPYTSYVKGGYVAVDGTSRKWDYKLTDMMFHVISAAPTNNVPVRTITIDRNARAGGSYQGELMAFQKHLEPARRLYVQKYLAWKWLGEGEEPVYTNSLSSLSLAHGGTVAFAGAPDVHVPTVALDGAGTVRVGRLTGIESLSFDIRSETDYDRLTVDGILGFAESGTLSVNIGPDVSEAGDYPIVEADAFEGGNPLRWTRTVTNTSNLSATLYVNGSTLYLRLMSKGTLLLFR